jgi:DNA-binding MarR family transcriptional regulator
LAPVGVRSTQLAVLIALGSSQPLSIGSLAELLSVDTTTLTRSLRPIRKQGLLAISERSAMRQRFVTLTRKGTRTLTDSMPLWRDVQTRFEKAIGKDHWQVLQRELARVSATARRLELGCSKRS